MSMIPSFVMLYMFVFSSILVNWTRVTSIDFFCTFLRLLLFQFHYLVGLPILPLSLQFVEHPKVCP